jgi:hypothetical protein
MFIAAIFTMPGDESAINEWIKKMWYVYTKEFYLAMKTNKIVFRKMNEQEITMLSEISQTLNDKYHMFSLMCGIWG